MSVSKKPSIFKKSNLPMDTCHVKSVMSFADIDQELFKKYYSPSAVSLQLVLESVKILEGFYGDKLLEKDNAKLFFPKDTMDPILILYEVPVWEDGHWESRKTASNSMVIAIAPRARINDEKSHDFPMLSEIETKEKELPQ